MNELEILIDCPNCDDQTLKKSSGTGELIYYCPKCGIRITIQSISIKINELP